LAGCGGAGSSGGDGPTATVPTVPPDPFAVPPVIDEAYVNRVLAALDQADGDVLRMVVSTKTIPPEVIERLKALYVGEELLQLQVDVLQSDLFNRLDGYKPVPGNKRTNVTRLITARPSCIFAEVSRDFSEVAVSPDPRLAKQWIGLVPMDSTLDRRAYNRTTWIYIYEGFPNDGSEPEDPCAKVS
jgi:hypothetical protein